MDLTIVLKPGPARRVDPGLGRPGPGTGPGLGKNPSGSWPGKPGRTAGSTRTTRANPAETRHLFLYIYMDVKPRRFGLLFSISTVSQKPN
jgi:hypothetical protein